MAPGPEDIAREQIDRMLELSAGWAVQDAKAVNLYAKQGVAIREFELKPGFGTADYLLYVDGKAAGVIEAKKAGSTLTGVEIQSAKYSKGLPDGLPAWTRPLPFCYQSTGIETRFTNGFDPEPCSRQVFFFHKPETFADWLSDGQVATSQLAAMPPQQLYGKQPTLNSRIRQMPPLIEDGPLASADSRDQEPRKVAFRKPSPRAHPDGDRKRQDLHCHHLPVPVDQVRRGQSGSCSSLTGAISAGRP